MSTLGEAVRKKCKQCIYDPAAPGSWRQQTEACTVTGCALHDHRPVTDATKEARKQAILDAMSPEDREKAEAAREKRAELAKQRFWNK